MGMTPERDPLAVAENRLVKENVRSMEFGPLAPEQFTEIERIFWPSLAKA
jgi:hypothetical protein